MQNTTKQYYPGLVASYDTQPCNNVGSRDHMGWTFGKKTGSSCASFPQHL